MIILDSGLPEVIHTFFHQHGVRVGGAFILVFMRILCVLGCDKCVTSTKANKPLAFEFCKEMSEDQNVEIGEFLTLNGSHVLRPLGGR